MGLQRRLRFRRCRAHRGRHPPSADPAGRRLRPRHGVRLLGSHVLSYPGVEVAAADPWAGDGEDWRGVRATFPETIDTHSATQLYYFDAEGRLARLDYEPEINGGAPTAHYQPEHVTAGGLVVASRHEVFARNPDGTPDRSWMPIGLDLTGITVR